MGQYENPIAVINTQADQIFAQAIANTGTAIAKVLDNEQARRTAEQKAEREWLDWTYKHTLDNKTEVFNQLEKVGANNQASFDSLGGLINSKNQFEIDAKKTNDPEEQRSYLQKAANAEKQIRAFINNTKELKLADAEFSANVLEGFDKLGEQGGLDLSGPQSEEYKLAMSIRAGVNPGTEAVEQDEKTGRWVNVYRGEKIDTKYPNGIRFEPMVLAAFDPTKIPEWTKGQTELVGPKTEKNTTGLGFRNEKGELADDFVEIEISGYELSADKTMEFPVYAAKLAEMTPVLTERLNAKSNGFLKSPEQAVAMWNNTMRKEGEPELKTAPGGIGTFDLKSSQMFQKSYLEAGLLQMPVRRLGEGVKVTKEKPIKATASEIKAFKQQKSIEKRLSDIEKVFGTKESPLDNLLMQNLFVNGKMDLTSPVLTNELASLGINLSAPSKEEIKDNNGKVIGENVYATISAPGAKPVTLSSEQLTASKFIEILTGLASAGDRELIEYDKTTYN